jgi:hypothetical protein
MLCCSRRDLLSDHIERLNNSLKLTRLAGGKLDGVRPAEVREIG